MEPLPNPKEGRHSLDSPPPHFNTELGSALK